MLKRYRTAILDVLAALPVGVAILYAALLAFGLITLPGCGPSHWLSAMRVAEGVQEESVKRQSEETDSVLKLGHLACTAWTHRYHAAAQDVLVLRGKEAAGDTTAAPALVKAEALASRLKGVYVEWCDLARQTSRDLKGVDLPAYQPPAQPAAAPQPSAAAPPAQPAAAPAPPTTAPSAAAPGPPAPGSP